jgi:hypothetical protein
VKIYIYNRINSETFLFKIKYNLKRVKMVSKDCLFFRNSKTAGYKKKLMLQNNNSNNNNFICEDDAFGLSANKQFDDDDGGGREKMLQLF